ncbi:MAG: hypothetical protein SFZ24_12490 [Planctomycetota bacterium]|nr:hypothetical protein [Planctomycetota bacterium]
MELPEVAATVRDPIAGDRVILVMKDGDRLEGEFVSRSESTVSVKISGVTLRVEASSLERVVVVDDPRERYRQMKARIKPDDAERLVMLAAWLQRQELYEEALAELGLALESDPTHAEGLRLQREVRELAALRRRSRPAGAREAGEDSGPEFPTRPRIADFPLLTEEQINLIKVYEVDLTDPPKIVIERAVVERFLSRYAEEPLIPDSREERAALAGRPAPEILDLMFRLRAREFYPEVRIVDIPESMRFFRDNIHATWLVSHAATTRCHGGSNAGRLRLFNYRPTAEESVFTNFLILERFRTRDGSPLINYDEPERSLLIQYGLPRNDARFPHPPARGWRPVFTDRDSRRYQQTLEWIRMMYRPRPDYPVEYTPPGEIAGDRPGVPGGPGVPAGPVER